MLERPCYLRREIYRAMGLYGSTRTISQTSCPYVMYRRNDFTKLPYHKSKIICAEDILGPNLGSLNGKTTCKMP